MGAKHGWRAAARALALTALVFAACTKSAQEIAKGPLRLGFFPSITHAQALVGNAEGRFVKALGDVKLEVKQFNAGPSAMEALASRSLDISYVGTGPAINTYLKGDRQLRVIAGAVNGGAVLVARTAKAPQDLKGKKVASPQLGNSQDIALRHWLKSHGLTIAENSKGDVQVLPLANPDIFSLFLSGQLEAAWVPEPWGARLVVEAGAQILVDERDLWPNRAFSTTVLATTVEVLKSRPADIRAILRVHVELTREWRDNPRPFETKANDAFAQFTGKKLPERVLRDAFSRIEPTTTPLPSALSLAAKHAQELGYLPTDDVSGMVDTSLLEEVLRSTKS